MFDWTMQENKSLSSGSHLAQKQIVVLGFSRAFATHLGNYMSLALPTPDQCRHLLDTHLNTRGTDAIVPTAPAFR
ncbi:MAG: hypothetical protein JO271_16870 [Verrucomicrobia bacterium]|nr:hypothetical protein [Verrucomicrobiota bacterium]